MSRKARRNLSRDEALDLVGIDSWNFRTLNPILRSDKEIVLAAIHGSIEDSAVLDLMDPTLREDRDIIIEALKQSYTYIGYFPEWIRDDKSIMAEVISVDGAALQYASDRLRDEEDLVSLSIKDDGENLRRASTRLQRSIPLTMKAANHADGIASYAFRRMVSFPPVYLAYRSRATNPSQYPLDRVYNAL